MPLHAFEVPDFVAVLQFFLQFRDETVVRIRGADTIFGPIHPQFGPIHPQFMPDPFPPVVALVIDGVVHVAWLRFGDAECPTSSWMMLSAMAAINSLRIAFKLGSAGCRGQLLFVDFTRIVSLVEGAQGEPRRGAGSCSIRWLEE